jgi:hypothetical protein
MRTEMPPCHPEIRTWVDSIKYDFVTRAGTIDAVGPVDASGSINTFLAMDPEVKSVTAFLEGKPDIYYRRANDGKSWYFVDLRHRRVRDANLTIEEHTSELAAVPEEIFVKAGHRTHTVARRDRAKSGKHRTLPAAKHCTASSR